MSWPVFTGFHARVRIDHDPRGVGTFRAVFGLLTDAMQASGDMFERADKRAIRRGHANVMPEAGKPGHESAHRIFANATHRNESRSRIRSRMIKSRGKALPQI